MTLDAERAVLGALLTGALRHGDIVDAPDGLCANMRHRRVFDVIASLLEMRSDAKRWKVPGAPGVDWRFAERACRLAKAWAIGVVSVEPPVICGLLELARKAPRRRGALAALDLIVADARARADMAAERARLREAVRDATEEAVVSYLHTALAEADRSGFQTFTTTRRKGYGRDEMPHGTPGSGADSGHWIGVDVIREAIAAIGQRENHAT